MTSEQRQALRIAIEHRADSSDAPITVGHAKGLFLDYDRAMGSVTTWRLWAMLLAIFAVTQSLVAFGWLSHCVCDRRFFEPWF